MMRPPLFARHAGKRPWGPIVIAALLTLHGLGLAGEFLVSLPDPSLATSFRSIGFAYVAAGIGLFYLYRPLRTLALILVWVQLVIGIAFAAVILLDDARENFWAPLFLLLPIWEYVILVRRRNRELFGLTKPVRTPLLFGVSAASVFVIVLGIPLLVNVVDERPDPIANTWADTAGRPVPASPRNRYYAFIGFTSADDAHTAGLARWQQFAQAAPHTGRVGEGEAGIDTSGPYVLRGDGKQLCRPAAKIFNDRQFSSACLAHYREHRPAIHSLLAQNRALLNRYRTEFLNFTATDDGEAVFIEPNRLVDAYPRVSAPVLDAHYLAQAHALSLFDEGHALAAIAQVRNDLRFWRAAMAGSCHLVTKMIATRAVSSSLAVLLEMAQSPRATRAALQAIGAAVPPLTDAERDLSCAMQMEFRLVKESVEQARTVGALLDVKDSHWMYRLPLWAALIKRNATVNLLIEDVRPWIELAAGDGYTFNDRLRTLKAAQPWGLSNLYNLGGRITAAIIGVGDGRFTRYVQRVHDTDAFIRLVRIQTELRLQPARPAHLETFLRDLAQRNSDFRDPYAREPFRWADEGARVFSVGYHGNHLKADGDYTVGISVVFSTPQK